MKKMKQTAKFVACLVVAALLASVSPKPSSAAGIPAEAPKMSSGRGTINLEYLGARRCVLFGTTTAASCAAALAHGMLYELCAFGTGAVAGKGVMAYDSASAAGIASVDVSDAFVASYAMSPIVYGSAASPVGTVVNPAAWTGCWKPNVPIRYESGFVMRLMDASLGAVALVRPDTGVNP